MPAPRPLGSRYTLLEPLGRGASGQVWRGEDHDGRPYAVKLLHEELTRDRKVVGRFVQERDVLADLDHPHVVRVHDLVAEGATLAIVMELVEGSDLRTLLRDRGPLPPEHVARLGAQVASGLAAAHGRGIVHRDVKPDNVLVRAGRVDAVLSDFGVARLLDESGHSGTILGTPQYFAPESLAGDAPTPAVDLFALGVTLYEMCCGTTPFADHRSLPELLRAHATLAPGRPIGVGDDLWRPIEALLNKDPRERPDARSVAAYLDALAPRLAGLPAAPTAAAPPPPLRARPGPRTGAHAAPNPAPPGTNSGTTSATTSTSTAAPRRPDPAERAVAVLSVLVVVAALAFLAWVLLR